MAKVNEQCSEKEKDSMVIHLGCRLDGFYFGLEIPEIIQMLGRPDKISDDEREGFVVYYYNQIMTKFYFLSEADNKLVTIEVFHPDTYLWNQKILGKKMSEIKELLNERNLQMGPVEDYDFFEVIFCEEIWTVFCFKYDRVESIEFSVLLDENNNWLWPEKP